MTYSLWDQAQGKAWFDCSDAWPRRCRRCGRRIGLGDYASVYVGKTDTAVVVHEICSYHSGKHADCLNGITIDFGNGKSWPVIWMDNLLDETIFWLRAIMRFTWDVLVLLLNIMVQPRRYLRYRRWLRELREYRKRTT